MSNSVGKTIRSINKEGINNNYFLLGNDSFLQKFLVDKIQIKFDQLSKVNYLNLNEESDMLFLINELQTVSMFSTKNIFILKNFKNITKKNKFFLEEYTKRPNKDNLLVFVLDDYRINNQFIKNLSNNSMIVDIQTPFYNNKIKEWINYYLHSNDYQIDNKIIDFFIDNYNDDMSNIINEIEKLNLFNNGDKLDSNEYNVFYNNRHTKIWNLIDSIGKKELNKSIKIYKNLLLNGVSLVPIIINFTTFYLELLSNENNQYNGLNKIINSRMNKYRSLYKSSEILNIIIALRNLDILIKSTNIKDDILFTPVIFKICKGYYV